MFALYFKRFRRLLWSWLRATYFILKEITTLQVLFLTPTVLTLLWLPNLFEPKSAPQQLPAAATSLQEPQATTSDATTPAAQGQSASIYLAPPQTFNCEPDHATNP